MENNYKSLEGKIISLERRENTIYLSIINTKSQDPFKLPLPIKINNDFQLIPYENALLNQTIKYSTKKERVKLGTINGLSTRYNLEICSGTLKGITYNDRSFPPDKK